MRSEEGGQIWHWITGDTYPHRELLKRHGARWSKKRQAWYWGGAALPAAIGALVTSEAQPEITASSGKPVSPLLTIFGGRIVGKDRASNGNTILKGENGIFARRTTWIDRNERPETVWVFDLPPHDRVNLTFRQSVAALCRRTWAYAQTERHLLLHCEWFRLYYHFARSHESLAREVPGLKQRFRARSLAMALDFTDHPWSVHDLLHYPVPQVA